ncbi:hypothetical protein ANCDUO_00215 [Ancylostoma duodenale]|uniref:Uncharacterized protein n=1 Tax=Ancylostoma duodenale TaxID=51022 RepID=A0A0C2H6F8_9BILA|nr:hypothetical protein ANCDUO_00215 [Ancylostoma duodenale]
MSHGLSKQRFQSFGDVYKWVEESIETKDEASSRRGIRLLPERWEEVIANNGQYFDWCTCFFLNKDSISVKKGWILFHFALGVDAPMATCVVVVMGP